MNNLHDKTYKIKRENHAKAARKSKNCFSFKNIHFIIKL